MALICPKCKSNKVREDYPNLLCLNCGFAESLIDFPISFNEHRRLCLEYGKLDSGPDESPEHNLNELHERLVALEESAQSEKPRLDQPRNKRKPKAEGVRL